MNCPYCGCTNKDSAKFCKKCGKSLSPVSTNEFIGSPENGGVNDSNRKSSTNLIIICITVIICIGLIMGCVLFISYNNDSNDNNSISDTFNKDNSANAVNDSVNKSNNNSETNKTNQDISTTTTTQKASTPSTISHVYWVEFYLDGNPNTGCDATIYVGQEYSGEQVEVSMSYSRDGYYFESEGYHWYTVGSDGTIFVRTYAPLNKYPDKCDILLTHKGHNLSLTCPMKKHKGTQRVNL